MPALAKVRNQAKAIICRSNLKQFGLNFAIYTENNNGFFGTGWTMATSHRWQKTLEPYYEDRKLLLCPMAAKPSGSVFSGKFTAWDLRDWIPPGGGPPPYDYVGSYGINEWVSNSELASFWGYGLECWWRTPNVRGAANVPVLLDSNHNGGFPLPFNLPPAYDGEPDPWRHYMKSHCINRHDGYINGLFLDFSVKKVGLKELWTFEWYRGYDKENPYTILGHGGGTTGRVDCANYWDSKADWMKNFKEY